MDRFIYTVYNINKPWSSLVHAGYGIAGADEWLTNPTTAIYNGRIYKQNVITQDLCGSMGVGKFDTPPPVVPQGAPSPYGEKDPFTQDNDTLLLGNVETWLRKENCSLPGQQIMCFKHIFGSTDKTFMPGSINSMEMSSVPEKSLYSMEVQEQMEATDFRVSYNPNVWHANNPYNPDEIVVNSRYYGQIVKETFLRLMMDPYAHIDQFVYGLPSGKFAASSGNFGPICKLFRGFDELGMGVPKFLSDQVLSKTLLNSMYLENKFGPTVRASTYNRRVRTGYGYPYPVNIDGRSMITTSVDLADVGGGSMEAYPLAKEGPRNEWVNTIPTGKPYGDGPNPAQTKMVSTGLMGTTRFGNWGSTSLTPLEPLKDLPPPMIPPGPADVPLPEDGDAGEITAGARDWFKDEANEEPLYMATGMQGPAGIRPYQMTAQGTIPSDGEFVQNVLTFYDPESKDVTSYDLRSIFHSASSMYETLNNTIDGQSTYQQMLNQISNNQPSGKDPNTTRTQLCIEDQVQMFRCEGYERFNTQLVRNIVFITNLQRLMRYCINMWLSKSMGVLSHGSNRAYAAEVTERRFGNSMPTEDDNEYVNSPWI